MILTFNGVLSGPRALRAAAKASWLDASTRPMKLPHRLSKFCQMGVTTLAPKERAAKLGFQFLNGTSQGWLRDIAPFRSSGEIERLGNGQEIATLVEFHIDSIS